MTVSPLALKLIEALTACPTCRADRREENRPEDGIPDNCVYEAVYTCGAAVFVTSADEYELGRACPHPLDIELDDLQQRTVDAWENAQDLVADADAAS